VVKEAVASWEREEESIDDITCIIVFFKRSNDPMTDATDKTSQQFDKPIVNKSPRDPNSKR
jgi:hypothetical protein